jgi:integrase
MLSSDLDIIPTFESNREKTNKYFITYCTPECTKEILHYLKYRLSRGNWNKDSKLFKIDGNYFTLKFDELNTALGLGKAGEYNVFRSHMLRKFHASHLRKAGMDIYSINILQGKSNNSVDEVYFLEDTKQLRKDYIKYMHSLFIFTDVHEITVESEEVLLIKQENEMLRKRQEKLEDISRRVAKLENK